jgi:peptidoglycan-associated lipoprotein
MNLVMRPHYRALFCLTLAAAMFSFGCAKKPVAQTPPPPAPYTPPPATPTVTLQANPTSINAGDSAALSWSSTNATQLTITPDVGQVTAQGSTKVTPTSSVTYSITATGPGGSANASARVTVATPPPPDTGTSSDLTDALFLKEVRDAYFDLDKADIRADARTALSHDAEFLRNYPQLKVTIEGHCDERGSTEYNLGLGDRRAAAVKQYLVSQGISADRINTVSFGKEKPFCNESTEECWQQNRRGHFVKAN